MTFIPTVDLAKDEKNQLELDFQNYLHKIKLAAYYGSTPNPKGIRPFVGPSIWTPPPQDLPPQVQQLINNDLKKNIYFLNYKFIKERLNISWEKIKISKKQKTT